MVKAVQTSAPAQVSFLDSIKSLATPVNKLSSAQAQQDPKLAARVRFANQVAEQIKAVKAGDAKSRWFNLAPTGVVTITLRNGNTAMPLGGTTYFETASKDSAVKFFEAIIAGAKAGELDEALTTTARPARVKKEKAVSATAAPAPTPSAT